MANSVLTIGFTAPLTVGQYVQFVLGGNLVRHDWETTRSASGEVTAALNVADTVKNYITALNLDASGLYTASELNSNTVRIEASEILDTFSDGESDSEFVSFSTFNLTPNFSVSNFSGNYYLINNDVILNLTATQPGYFTVRLDNLTNGKFTANVIVYVDSDLKASINLSPLVKSIMRQPDMFASVVMTNVRGSDLFRLTILHSSNGFGETYTKWYIRGGNRTNNTNQVLSPLSFLIPSEKIPVWSGYPYRSSYLTTNNGIQTNSSAITPENIKDYRRIKSCNPLYVRFLNQKGGESYWLFETSKETEQNDNMGSYIKNNKVDDLGNESNSTVQAYSKVPANYIEMIKDLIVSPEIYFYDNGNWIRTLSSRNSIVQDDNKKAYSVKINFDMEYRFNPSVLWSN